jgi:hypothetical protein
VSPLWFDRGDQAPVAAERCVPVAAGRKFSADPVKKALEVPQMRLRMEVTTRTSPNKQPGREAGRLFKVAPLLLLVRAIPPVVFNFQGS